jgi:hypothetical protein
MAVYINQQSTVLTDIFAPTLGPTGLPDIQVFGLNNSIQLRVMLYPTVAWLVEVVSVLAG